MTFVSSKPLDEELLHEVGKKFRHIVTIEDGIIKGGMGCAILEFMADNGYYPEIRRIGVPDQFIEHGSVQQLYHLCGMDEEGIYKVITKTNYEWMLLWKAAWLPILNPPIRNRTAICNHNEDNYCWCRSCRHPFG